MPQPPSPPALRYWQDRVPQLARERFTAIGWTYQDWARCHRVRHVPAGRHDWLKDPPVFLTAITPDECIAVTRRYGWRSPVALTALAASVPTRLVHSVMDEVNGSNPQRGWDIAQQLGWTEDQAVGWSRAGLLQSRGWPAAQEDAVTVVIRRTRKLTELSGPDGYLWVLAGYDAAEARKIVRESGPVSAEQLRVMAILDGADLPA